MATVAKNRVAGNLRNSHLTNGQSKGVDIVSAVETITPEIAAGWWKRNKKNRRFSDLYALDIAAIMEAGEWEVNGESIKFDENGDLFDGQHRVKAVILSNTTIRSVVTRGVKRSTFHSADRGRKRSNGDMLFVMGEKYADLLAGSLQWLSRFEDGAIVDRGRRHKLSGPKCLALLKKNPLMRNSAPVGQTVHMLLNPCAGAFCHYLFAKIDQDLATLFFDALRTGENLKRGEPVHKLREKLIENRGKQAKAEMNVCVAWTIKTWNSLRDGTSLGRLQWRSDEAFPVPR